MMSKDRKSNNDQAIEEIRAEFESFLYTVSHDLNGPLVSLAGYLGFIESDYGESLPSKGRFYLERMDASVRHMQAMIAGLLELSRIGRIQSETERVALARAAAEAAGELQEFHPELEIEFDDLPEVKMNPYRARQLFHHLFENSARYAGPNPRVKVSGSNSGELATISVTDSGRGIAPEHRERAFNVFDRLDAPPDPDEIGVGLALCKRIVESSGGRIWIEDSPAGLDMRMTLPMVEQSAKPRQRERV